MVDTGEDATFLYLWQRTSHAFAIAYEKQEFSTALALKRSLLEMLAVERTKRGNRGNRAEVEMIDQISHQYGRMHSDIARQTAADVDVLGSVSKRLKTDAKTYFAMNRSMITEDQLPFDVKNPARETQCMELLDHAAVAPKSQPYAPKPPAGLNPPSVRTMTSGNGAKQFPDHTRKSVPDRQPVQSNARQQSNGHDRNGGNGRHEVEHKDDFISAREQLRVEQNKKYGGRGSGGGGGGGGGGSFASHNNFNAAIDEKGSGPPGLKAALGIRRNGPAKFVPPLKANESNAHATTHNGGGGGSGGGKSGNDSSEKSQYSELMEDDRLKSIDPKMVELIMNEIMDRSPKVSWNDIAGLHYAKRIIQEIVVWPMQRPDIFCGLRGPPKGLLLFGPPGTGKTLIGKCIAHESDSTFFSISASSLTSKYVGEGEKMTRALFAVARCHQPAVIFIDEIDSLLSQRSESEHEASRRIKTEFLIQLDGATTQDEDRILVIGATNRPQEIDEAARRRLVKRLYIPLPDMEARKQIIVNLMNSNDSNLSDEDINALCAKTDGYSGADMCNLCKDAALGPIRSITDIRNIRVNDVRKIDVSDFEASLKNIRASVSAKDLDVYLNWNKQFGSCGV